MRGVADAVDVIGWLRGAPLAGDTLLTLAVTACAQCLALALQVLFARYLGPVEFGIYSVAIAWLGLALIVAKGGLDTALVRLVAGFRSRGEPGRMGPALAFARRSALLVALVLGVLAVGTAGLWPGEGLARYRDVLVLLAIGLPVAAWSELHGAALRGCRRLLLALSGDGIVRPAVAAALSVAIWSSVPGPPTAVMALGCFLMGTLCSAIVTATGLRALQKPLPAVVAHPADHREWRRLGLSLMVANGALVAMYSVDAVIIGLLGTPAAAGFFAVASRVAMFVLFVMNASQVAAAPRLAAAAGDREELRSAVRMMNGLSLAAALPIGVVLGTAAEPLLGMFGPGFDEAGSILRLLVVAQLCNVLTGPTGAILSMAGRERELAMLVSAGLLMHIGLATWLVPVAGAEGAAVAALVSHGAWNLAAVLRIRRSFGFDPTVLDLLSRAPGPRQRDAVDTGSVPGVTTPASRQEP